MDDASRRSPDGAPGRPRRWTLRAYLIGLLVLFVAAAGAGGWAAWRHAERDALATARADATFAAGKAAQEVGQSLAVVRGSVDAVAGNPGIATVYADPSSCRLAFALTGGAGGGHLDLLRSDGTVICSSAPPAGDAQRGAYRGAAWLPEALRAARDAAPVRDERTGAPAVLITAPIPGLGVAAAFMDLAALGSGVGELFGGARRLEFVLTTADGGTLLTRWPGGARWTGVPARDSRLTVPDGGGEGSDVTGVRRVYGQAGVEGTGWRLSAGADRAAALADADRLARQQALIAGLGLLAGLLATLLIQRRIARPIGNLRTAVRAAAVDGDLGAAVPVAGPREVAELGEEFNALLITVDRELVERRRAEESAREHERNYRQMFDASPYPMLLHDAESLELIAVNDAAVRFYGRSREALLAMRVTGLCPAEDAESLLAAVAVAEPVEYGRRQRHIRHDGSAAEVSVTSYVMAFGGRKVRCAVIEDVTEREHLEHRLRQSERLESLGHLAAGIAHDFNNLLSIINGYAAMAADEVQRAADTDPAWRTVHSDLVEIVAAGDRAAGLTRQLLAFARADPAPQTRVLDLNDVVTDVGRLLRRALGEDVTLRTELAEQPWPVRADPGRLEQVLLNLAVNARDAMPAGGVLTIGTDAVTVDEHEAARDPALGPGRYMRLTVTDTGTGMSKATLDRAFEPFFTTKPSGQGTGLGLATIYGIVTQAGGDVRIASELGRGTTITILLPATDEPVDGQRAPGPSRRSGAGETILLVEDDDALRALAERVLGGAGYVVLPAANAAEARRVAAGRPGVDLLLTDVVLPDRHGPALATALRDEHPDLRVVFLSGYTDAILAERGIAAAGATLLTKPVSGPELLDTVARVLSTG